jgi:hypothetical protein
MAEWDQKVTTDRKT